MKRRSYRTLATVVYAPYEIDLSISTIDIEYKVEETAEMIKCKMPVAGNAYDVGDKLPVLYSRDNPHIVRFDGGKNYIALLLFTVLIAAFFVFAAFKIDELF